MEPIIKFENFGFKYNAQQKPTLYDINLSIHKGEKLLIAGPSGCGKSTLAHCINGLIPSSYRGEMTGSLTIAGKESRDMGIFEISRHVGTVLQDSDSQFIGLTVAEDIAFALENDCVALSDGGCFKTLQVVFEAAKLPNYEEVAHAGLYTSMRVTGRLILTPQAKQPFELNADRIEILGACPSEDYPLQKKKMSMEYLRTMPTLRPRTNTFNAAFRVRSVAAYAIHRFFQENGFVYAHSPILTASDCEGAGEMFRVTTLDLDDLPKTEDGRTDYSQDFFGKPVNLTVSGQLEAEAMAMAFGKVYTFGPTFRAEKSFTTRHAAEFWMIEPEMAFCDLSGYMDVAEAMTKYVIRYVLDNCPDEMDFFNKFIDKGLIERLELVAGSEFGRVSYTDAIEILKKNNKKFQYPVEWGVDIQTEHERYLTEVVFQKPVFVTDYPKEIKSFYMKQNPDGRTVAAADMLVPGIGELIGGSQREEDYGKLAARMDELGLDKAGYDWYLDLRRFGTVEHAGFGLGFERMLMYLTGIQNIRDVLPFPRTAYGF